MNCADTSSIVSEGGENNLPSCNAFISGSSYTQRAAVSISKQLRQHLMLTGASLEEKQKTFEQRPVNVIWFRITFEQQDTFNNEKKTVYIQLI